MKRTFRKILAVTLVAAAVAQSYSVVVCATCPRKRILCAVRNGGPANAFTWCGSQASATSCTDLYSGLVDVENDPDGRLHMHLWGGLLLA